MPACLRACVRANVHVRSLVCMVGVIYVYIDTAFFFFFLLLSWMFQHACLDTCCLSVLYPCVLYFCICPCTAQFSMFHMEKRSRNALVTIIIIIIICSDKCNCMCCHTEIYRSCKSNFLPHPVTVY